MLTFSKGLCVASALLHSCRTRTMQGPSWDQMQPSHCGSKLRGVHPDSPELADVYMMAQTWLPGLDDDFGLNTIPCARLAVLVALLRAMLGLLEPLDEAGFSREAVLTTDLSDLCVCSCSAACESEL